jgi:lipopolysaccharide assembly outer membrane protein LptD (OstA)
MRKLLAAFMMLGVFFVSGCFHINDTKFEQQYFNDVSRRIDRAKVMSAAQSATPETVQITAQKTTQTAGAAQGATSTAKTASVQAVKKKRSPGRVKELKIASDKMVYATQSKLAVFTGNVVIDAAGSHVLADRLESPDYQKSAEATGHVKAFYPQHGVNLESKKISYKDGLNVVTVTDDVIATKVLQDGNTLTIYCDRADFKTEGSDLEAIKVKKRVRMEFKDVVAFADKVVYNDEKQEVRLYGRPVFKRKRSLFFSDLATLNVNTKVLRLQDNVWTKIFYQDMESANKEVQNETSKSRAPR